MSTTSRIPAESLLTIGICDDEPSARASVRSLAEELAASLGIPANIHEFASANSLLASPISLDILFLDVEMPNGNGIQAGRQQKATNPSLDIVLVTGFEEYAVEGYSIDAKRYLLKPLSRERFFRLISPVFREHVVEAKKTIALVSDGEVHSVSPRDIVYVCTKPPKRVRIHTPLRDIVIRDSLKSWEGLLRDEPFFRCHSAFLVNMRFVRVIGKADVELVNGERIPLSRHRRRQFVEAFASYAGGLL